MQEAGIPGDPQLAEEYLHPEDRANELMQESGTMAENRELVREAKEYRESRGELTFWQKLVKRIRG
jgi:hypothetical protein